MQRKLIIGAKEIQKMVVKDTNCLERNIERERELNRGYT